MHLLFTKLKQFLLDDSGSSATEYAILAAFIALIIVASLVLVGLEGQAMYLRICNGIAAAAGIGNC
ncbi:MAG: Flp family type IVb pilin [Burkholderiaceae bacterium]